ncbi:hypothetical protein LXL04_031046 [Taraxacum kok-saghyz]
MVLVSLYEEERSVFTKGDTVDDYDGRKLLRMGSGKVNEMIQLEIVKEAIAGNSGRQEILDWGEVMEQIERRIIEGGKEINAGVEKTDFSNYPPQVSEIAAV